jgi:hypothetical protein
MFVRPALSQIVPASSNGVDAVNFRHLRDSKSLDFDDHGSVVSVRLPFRVPLASFGR